MFSAVHGVVLLGLQEKLGGISVGDLRAQTAMIVTALGQG
jgi:hypothetical protein